MKPDVTIGIPTYCSEAFIDRTLTCARLQTHQALRIVVSIDLSDDGTLDICRRHAREDDRIDVVVQPARLGWSQNANALLERVDTEFGLLYFHDDIIEPTYVTRLVEVLRARPEAASAHCDLVEFGLWHGTKPAHNYDGPTFRRLIDFMLTRRGTTLRSLIRTEQSSDSLRFPKLRGDRDWTAYVFHMRLLAAGPAFAVHEPLYRRWRREGSLTRSSGWRPEDLDTVVRTQREAASLCLDLIDEAIVVEDEKRAARYALKLFHLLSLRRQQLRLHCIDDIRPADIAPALAVDRPAVLDALLDAELQEWVRGTEERIAELERRLDEARQTKGG